MKTLFFVSLLFLILTACTKNDLPVACFDYYAIDTINGGIKFTSCSKNALEYMWDFGDGSTSNEQEPVHQFELAFPLKIKLIISNEFGADTLVETIEETQLDIKPIAKFSHHLEYRDDLVVVFTNETTNATKFEWDFGDGKNSNEMNPIHYYGRWGYFDVSLKASINNNESSISKQVEVVDSFHVYPSFYFIANENNPREINFFNTTRFGKEFLWEFGDGSTSTEKEPVHLYPEYRSYQIKFTAKNQYDSQSVYNNILVIKPENIVKACFEWEIDEDNPYKVYFHNCSTNATFFNWHFSDDEFSEEENPAHEFPSTNDDMLGFAELTASNENGGIDNVMHCLPEDCAPVGKPNIYLYPEKPVQLQLIIDFPMGGKVTNSVPEYGNGWDVYVEPNGRIDYCYNYLFYESSQVNHFQKEKGWCVAQSDLEAFFKSNMALYKFNEKEIEDFTKYWIPRLNFSPYFNVYPQTNQIIDEAIRLTFSQKPDNIIRLFYGIYPTNRFETLPVPLIPNFNREGFVATEWGVFQN